jgi:CubicO group peptidase (beta-lactamase class C family)
VSDGAFNVVADLALAATTPWPDDIRAVIEGETFDPPPWNVVLGRVRPRGAPTGAVLADGRRVAEWGPTAHVDMAFSVTKSYIGLLAAATLDRGLIPGFDAPVAATVRDPAFASTVNRTVTWRQLLDQTSEWEGSTFGIPDTVDRDRQLAPTDDPARFGRATPRHVPGTYWDYNDARVNALCLALTRLYGQGLPDVLAELHPAFADRSGWAWDGYGESSTVDLGGRRVEVAVGGGHWGGGLAATVDHHLALGTTILDRGMWEGRRVVSPEALDALLTPCPLQPVYGGLWWLNTGCHLFSAAPEDSMLAMGVGSTVLWVSRAAGAVACLRWIQPEAVNGVLAAILSGLEGADACATSPR